MALHWFGGYVSSFSPHGFFLVFRIRQCHRESFSRMFMLAAGARPKETKINLMDCICLCSEVEINIDITLATSNIKFISSS